MLVNLSEDRHRAHVDTGLAAAPIQAVGNRRQCLMSWQLRGLWDAGSQEVACGKSPIELKALDAQPLAGRVNDFPAPKQ